MAMAYTAALLTPLSSSSFSIGFSPSDISVFSFSGSHILIGMVVGWSSSGRSSSVTMGIVDDQIGMFCSSKVVVDDEASSSSESFGSTGTGGRGTSIF